MENKSKQLIYDITDFEYKREISQRLTYPFYKLNQITGGAEEGTLIYIFGKSNQGKSELVMQFLTHWIDYGVKTCAMLGEHTLKKSQQLLYKKVSRYNEDSWINVKYGEDKNGRDWGIYETFVSYEDEQKAISLFKNNLFLYDTKNGFTLKNILDAFEQGYQKGCKAFLLDNNMMIDLESDSENREESNNTERLRQWAQKHNVPIFIVAHSRKVDVGRIRLELYDIAGSSNIGNKTNTAITITRTNILNPNTKEFKEYARLLELNYINIHKCDAILEVVKEKNGKGVGFVPLKWFENTKTFKEVYDDEMIKKKEADREEKQKAYESRKQGITNDDKAVMYVPKGTQSFLDEISFEEVDSLPF